MPEPLRLLTAASVAFLAACAAQRSDPIEATIRDSAGVTVVQLPDLETMRFPRWQSTIVFSTASIDTLQLGLIPHAVFPNDSTLVLGDGSDLFLISLDGDVLRRLGRRGGGPGEFRGIWGVKIVSDGSIAVLDVATRKVTVLLPDGRVKWISQRIEGADRGREIDLVTVLGDGRMITSYWQYQPNLGEVEGIKPGKIVRDTIPLVLRDSSGRLLEKLGEWQGLERGVVSLGGEPARLALAFARSVMYASREERTIITSTDSLDISMFVGTRLVGRMFSPSTAHRPTPVQSRAWRAAVEEWDSTLAPGILRALASASQIDVLPSLASIALDNVGNIWIGSYAAPGDSNRNWKIVSSTGKPVGALDLPAIVDPIVPSRSEILDAYGDLFAILVYHDGNPVVEVRRILR